MKLVKIIPAAALVVAGLAGCGGGSDTAAYCDDLKAADKSFSDLDEGNAADIEKAFATFHDLAKEAPSEVEKDWQKLDKAISTVEDGLEKAGIKVSQLDELQQGKIPKGVDPAKLQEVAGSFSELSGEDFTKASDAIEKHAKDECDIDLGN